MQLAEFIASSVEAPERNDVLLKSLQYPRLF